jgi:hypothetical protein
VTRTPAAGSDRASAPDSGPGALAAVAFLAETAMLAGLFWAGRSVGHCGAGSWLLGFVFAGAAAVVWGSWCAPRARTRLANPWRWIVKSVLFLGTLLLLVAFAPRPEGAVFGLGTGLLFLVSISDDRDV